MRTFLATLLVLTGCTASVDLDANSDSAEGVSGSTSALEGTREGYGVLLLLNDGEGTSFELLDDAVALDRRAAENLVAHRDGADGVFGTRDDDLFDTLAEVDAVRWVGPSALAKLTEFAQLNDYVPGDDDLLGSFDRVDFTYAQAEDVLAFVNSATSEEFSAASVPSRAVTSILAARPVETVDVLASLYWVGTRTLEHLLEAVAVPVGGEDCATVDDCAAGLRCVGRPLDFGYGKCRDISGQPGLQDDCAGDSDCNGDQICIAESVYGQGYCALHWMRDSFEVEGEASIPSVVMSEPVATPIIVYGQASVPEDIAFDIDIEHSDPSSLWIGVKPPTGQEPVTLWDGATMTGPLPTHYVDRSIYRDDQVNGSYQVLIQNVGGRGEGTVGEMRITISSRWD
ncbi:MAG: hypothetical protein GXP55_18865 [Deltaproteobacteria bacterium]|nr:hypothetical protein [Deltaproteobacteria bacterium]